MIRKLLPRVFQYFEDISDTSASLVGVTVVGVTLIELHNPPGSLEKFTLGVSQWPLMSSREGQHVDLLKSRYHSVVIANINIVY